MERFIAFLGGCGGIVLGIFCIYNKDVLAGMALVVIGAAITIAAVEA